MRRTADWRYAAIVAKNARARKKKKWSIFISHSGSRNLARRLSIRLRRMGADVFLDDESLHPGDEIDNSIFVALRKCDELVVILTHRSAVRKWVWIEVGIVRFRRKRTVGLLHQLSRKRFVAMPDVPLLMHGLKLVSAADVDEYCRDLRGRMEGKRK